MNLPSPSTPAEPTAAEEITDQVVLPALSQTNGVTAPQAPSQLDETGVESSVLCELAMKLAHSTAQFTTDWAAEQLCLPLQLVEEILWQLKTDKLVEVLGPRPVEDF